MKWIQVEFQGRRVRVPALRSAGKLWVHWLGQTYTIDLSGPSRRSGPERGKGQPGVVSAPMPGKVTRVAVQRGAHVVKGQALVVMEAMKMEYTLEADQDGQVLELNAVVGGQVVLGQVLIRLGVA